MSFYLPFLSIYRHSSTILATGPKNSISRFSLEYLIIYQVVEKFPIFSGTRKFSKLFTKSNHRTSFSAKRLQSAPSHNISLRHILILSSNLCLYIKVISFLRGLRDLISNTLTLHSNPSILLDSIILIVFAEE